MPCGFWKRRQGKSGGKRQTKTKEEKNQETLTLETMTKEAQTTEAKVIEVKIIEAEKRETIESRNMTENLNPHPANLSLAKQQEMTLMPADSAGAKAGAKILIMTIRGEGL
jgi:hypothetical protein